jgi:nitrous oxidase accessory protein NosD
VYIAQLVVTDRWGKASKPATVRITATGANKIPKANIAEILSQVSAGDTITLYGSASKDPDGDPLTYKWSLLFKPAASNASIAEPTAENSSFHVDVDGGYTIKLVVNDGKADSAAATVNISTRNAPQAGVRNVPADYPTIQAAIDAAQAGDDIVVHKGVYRELLVIDKSINLVGKDWPVIDGGSQKGNKNTISIFYLGDRAGKVEGFVIKGGGLGPLGHGINIWDSSPEIYHNKITGNNHGMGIHGSPSLTAKTKVHGNLIFNNKVGIGNGKDSVAHLFNNRIFNNKVVGIGSRGKGAPRIEANYIYGNRLGIGAREVASPRIEGNYIFNNTDGIVISPLSTIKKFAFKDIVINNNLIVNNDHLGINITSFNLSKVIITNNTINSNNKSERRIRGGGIILGYPQPATFTAIVENNLITNNKVGGLVKFIGPEDFVEPGADLLNKNNNVWNNSVDYLDCHKGQSSFSTNPGFAADLLTPAAAGVNGAIGGYRYSASAFSDLPAAE